MPGRATAVSSTSPCRSARTVSGQPVAGRSRGTRRERGAGGPGLLPWRTLVNPYPHVEVLSADQVEAIHLASLELLEHSGMRVLHEGARELLAKTGASVDNESQMVRFDRAMVMECVGSAPSEFTLHARNPRLVVVSVSCYGRTGPYAERAGAGTLAEAFAGFAHMNGEADGPPMVPSLPLGDTLSGFSGVIGTMMALYARDRADGGSGCGQHVDVSMVEPILQLLALPLASYDGSGSGPKRMGSRVAGGVPRNLYRAADGDWMALSGTTDAQVGRILTLIGCDDEEGRVRFGTSSARLAAADELDGLVARFIAGRSRDEALAAFHEIRIPVAPVNDLAALLDDPHLRERAAVTTLEDPVIGDVHLVTPAPRLSATPGRHRHTGPTLGEHTREILADWLGLDEAEVESEVEALAAPRAR